MAFLSLLGGAFLLLLRSMEKITAAIFFNSEALFFVAKSENETENEGKAAGKTIDF
jgi:hypothetical protein